MSLTASAPAAACGGKAQPDCPLQGWMKSTLQTYQREAKYERLAGAFDALAEHAPAGFAGWQEAARAGAEAARKQDAAGVRASCKGCHDEQRARYRSEQRAAAWP